MINLEQLKVSNNHDWHKPYGGQITLNCEDVDVLLRLIDTACGYLEEYASQPMTKHEWQEELLSKVSGEKNAI